MATPDQFIVDNTAEDWKALQYVREWCDISSAIDIATGHFEVGDTEDEWLIPLVGAAIKQVRSLCVRAGYDDARHSHYIELESRGIETQYLRAPGARHTEDAWAKRVEPFLRFLFPAQRAG